MASALHRARGDAAHEQFAGDEIDDQRDQAGEQRGRHVDVVFLHALDGVDDVVELHGHRVDVRPRVDNPKQKIVPDAGDLQDDRDDENRQRHRQHDLQIDAPESGAVDARGLEQLLGDGGEIVAEQQGEDRHAENRMNDDQPGQSAVEADLAQQDDDRIEHDLVGNEGADDQD